MPFNITKVPRGYKVFDINGRSYSKKPLSHEMASKQRVAIILSESKRKPYEILPYTFKKAKELNVVVKPSTDINKKIDVYKNGEKIASIGAKGMMDYPHYLKEKGKDYADTRKKLYYMRHTEDGIGSFYAKKLLW